MLLITSVLKLGLRSRVTREFTIQFFSFRSNLGCFEVLLVSICWIQPLADFIVPLKLVMESSDPT